MKSPRILVSSVDPWSENVGSDTLTTLLAPFDSSYIASINIRARKSDSPVASQYFHIIEDRVIRSIFCSSIVTGEKYGPSDSSSEKDVATEEKRYGRKLSFARFMFVLLREFLWGMGHWKSSELDEFVEGFNPEVFFFPIEGYIHFNHINHYIIEKFHPKRVVGYMWDDNFTYKQHRFNFLYRIHRYWLRKSVKTLIQSCDVVFAINSKMKKELDAEYGIDSILLTKPIRDIKTPEKTEIREPIRMLFSGKLVIGRDKTIAAIVDAIRMVNKEKQRVVLDVYSGTPISSNMRARIDVPGSCNFKGFVPQKEVLEEQQKADILLFVESLTKQDMSARLSFSTKITDYLSAGKCIWAVGNKDLAPIDYFKEEDSAVVSCTETEIINQLFSIVDNNNIILTYAQKAFRCGVDNHNRDVIFQRFSDAILGDI